MVPPQPAPVTDPTLSQRLMELWERTGASGLHELSEGRTPDGGALPETLEGQADVLHTALMEVFRDTGDPQVFGLLFERNQAAFLETIRMRLRGNRFGLDPQDVLQDVFLNIYRYPNKFMADRPDAFRNWGFRIVRNTMFKALKNSSRGGSRLSLEDSEDFLPVEAAARMDPGRLAEDLEMERHTGMAWLLYLNLYLMHFHSLSEREQKALTMVEVDGAAYKDAADALGIKLENLKMVIFRGRRKIFRAMHRSLDTLEGLGDQPRVGAPAETRVGGKG